MYKRLIPYVLFGACILVILILVITKNEKDNAPVVPAQTQIETQLLTGNDLLKLYDTYQELIDQGQVKIILRDILGYEIPTANYEEFEHMIYRLTNYDVEIEVVDGVKEYNCYIESFENLINSLGNTPTYDRDKFRLYYLQDVNINFEEYQKPVYQNEFLSVSDLINNFKGHENDIVSGKIYFRVSDGDEITSYDYLVDLEDAYQGSNASFEKAFELSKDGNLKGYTFTKVKEFDY